ncbi:MAG TPA: tRNA 2-thiouridine(34) synthase MnmA, partial [Pseudomonadales bacterium]|nr:tRNA 2-thiouridine(34) synthase MnmA [Pseudomonadales bacterium]
MSQILLPADISPHARVIVGMSGGVDSSVAALLLKRAGFEVQGLFMKNWEEDDGTEYCTAKADLADARAVCEVIGIPLHEANFAAEYWDNVFSRFLTEYRAGRTPNPDVLCNREIKFNVFAEYAAILGADWIATGHYARIDRDAALPRLMKALDAAKDQSYFLQSVSAGQLEHCLFPLGSLAKNEVRDLAHAAGIPTWDKKDSTGICFIGERRFSEFLNRYIERTPGPIVSVDGDTLGEHQGLTFHTIGQRQGLGIGGVANLPDAPWYVVDKDMVANTLVVAQGNHHPALFSSALTCASISWVDGAGPELPSRLQFKTRYRQPDQDGVISRQDDGFLVTFEAPQRAVTPGQWLCVYDGDHCLGGGVIETRH